MAVGPSSPQEEGEEEVLKDEFIFPQPEPQPEPVLEDAKEAAAVAQRRRLAAMEAQGALPEPQPEPVVQRRKKKGKLRHRKPRGLAVELALSRAVIMVARLLLVCSNGCSLITGRIWQSRMTSRSGHVTVMRMVWCGGEEISCCGGCHIIY